MRTYQQAQTMTVRAIFEGIRRTQDKPKKVESKTVTTAKEKGVRNGKEINP